MELKRRRSNTAYKRGDHFNAHFDMQEHSKTVKPKSSPYPPQINLYVTDNMEMRIAKNELQ